VFKGVEKINDNLFVYSPLVLPFHKYWTVRVFNKLFLELQLSLIVSRLKFERPILWSYIPNAVEFLGKWKERISVYHCVDELSANPLIPKIIGDLENRFLAKVNIVFTSSKTLYESKKKLNSNTFYMPNVADFDHFNKTVLNEAVVPDDLLEVPAPRIGFVGAISRYKLDFELILRISRNHPEWSIVLIGAKGEGEKEADLGELGQQKNIFLTGGRKYDLLPGYLKGLTYAFCLI